MTPKELMISRYEAFKHKDWQYLANTSINQSIKELEQMPEVEWLKLEVIDTYDDIVEFKAYYRENNQIFLHHEKSKFVKINDKWKYLDGVLFETKIQRNEPCPCGSGKKFKKCCMNNQKS